MEATQSAQPVTERSATSAASKPPGLRRIDLPPRLFVPLHSIDSGVATLKSIGTRVKRGEALIEAAEGSGFVAIAPAGGTIAGTARAALLNGRVVDAVEISVDAMGATDDAPASAPEPPANLPDLLDRVRQAAVWADRGTSPNLLAQLALALRRRIDTVLCNALDADGTQLLNETVLRSFGNDVIAGLMALSKASGAARTWLACDSNSRAPDAAAAALRSSGGGAGAARKAIKVVTLANDYPQADPTLLLFALFGRKLRPGKSPVEQNVLIVDAPAARAIGRAMAGEAMLDVPLAVRDARRGRTHFALASVGTPLRFVLDALGVEARDATLRVGAALRDVRVSFDAIIAGGELAIDACQVSGAVNPDPCIRCGWCVSSCPTRVHPAGLLEAAQEGDAALADRYGIDACIECGICSFVCPSRLPLLAAIRTLKKN